MAARKIVPARKRPSLVALCFDTETTGLIDNLSVELKKQPEIIEFYSCLVDLDSGEQMAEIDVLIRPTIAAKLEKKITDITGLVIEDLRDSSTFPEVALRIAEAIEEAPAAVAHNATFDRDMVDVEFLRLDLELTWPPLICTVEQSQHYVPGRRLNLQALHEYLFGQKFEGAHRAKVDVQAMIRCCVEMRKRGDL